MSAGARVTEVIFNDRFVLPSEINSERLKTSLWPQALIAPWAARRISIPYRDVTARAARPDCTTLRVERISVPYLSVSYTTAPSAWAKVARAAGLTLPPKGSDVIDLKLTLIGPFAARDAAGRALPLRGAKAQAVIAMLALAPRMSRPRRWIEDQLWSRYDTEHASANLRQSLTKIRSALAAQADLLSSDRSTIALDPARVEVDALQAGPLPDGELLQGLDARDPEFEAWLRQERTALAERRTRQRHQPTPGVLIACTSETDISATVRMMGDVLSNQIGESVAEQVRAWRQAPDLAVSTDPRKLCDVLLSTQIVLDQGRHAVFLRAVHQPSGRILHSRLHHFDQIETLLHQDDTVARLVFDAADRILAKLPQVLETARPESRATALSRQGMYHMFSFEKQALTEASGLMDQAYAHDDNPIYLAWSAQVRMIQLIERTDTDHEALRDEAVTLIQRAIEADHGNGMLQALAARILGGVLNDPDGSHAMARSAVETNPNNAFAWAALAEAQVMAGRFETALETSARGRRIAQGSPFRHFWDMGHCVIAIACNRPDLATEAGEAAARAAPSSRPALRHLLALYALRGDLDRAQAVARKLAVIEPGFSIDRIVNDDTYPVRTLRQQGLLTPLRALL